MLKKYLISLLIFCFISSLKSMELKKIIKLTPNSKNKKIKEKKNLLIKNLNRKNTISNEIEIKEEHSKNKTKLKPITEESLEEIIKNKKNNSGLPVAVSKENIPFFNYSHSKQKNKIREGKFNDEKKLLSGINLTDNEFTILLKKHISDEAEIRKILIMYMCYRVESSNASSMEEKINLKKRFHQNLLEELDNCRREDRRNFFEALNKNMNKILEDSLIVEENENKNYLNIITENKDEEMGEINK